MRCISWKSGWTADRFSGRRSHNWPAVALAIVTGCAALAPASAQTVLTDEGNGMAQGLTAHGHAELKIKPNVAYITVSVTTEARDQSAAVTSNATRSTNLIAALKQQGITSADLETQFYTVEPQYDYNTSPPISVGYQVTNSIQVTEHDLTKVGQILDTAARNGSTSASGVRFDIADHQKYQGEAIVAAVADARSRADLMAGAAGVSLVRLVSLTDSQPPQVTPVFMAQRLGTMAASSQATTPVESQQVDVMADVISVYAISPVK